MAAQSDTFANALNIRNANVTATTTMFFCLELYGI